MVCTLLETFSGIIFAWNSLQPLMKKALKGRIETKAKRSSRKAWLLITIFAIHSPFLLPSFLGGKSKEFKKNQTCGQKSCLSARSRQNKSLISYNQIYSLLSIMPQGQNFFALFGRDSAPDEKKKSWTRLCAKISTFITCLRRCINIITF